jgi:hypothetical protein
MATVRATRGHAKSFGQLRLLSHFIQSLHRTLHYRSPPSSLIKPNVVYELCASGRAGTIVVNGPKPEDSPPIQLD